MLYVEREHTGEYLARIKLPKRSHELEALNIEDFKNFNSIEVVYHIQQCFNFGFLLEGRSSINVYTIDDLTPKGHEFLANIRDIQNWNKTKEIAKKAGSISLDVLSQIASSVITNLLLGK